MSANIWDPNSPGTFEIPVDVTQAEAEAGTLPDNRMWSPLRVAQAIHALDIDGTNTAVRIAVIGDSTSSTNPLTEPSWPELLEASMNSMGGNVVIGNFSKGGTTFYSAYNSINFNSNQTQVQATIAFNPDIVIVCLGAVDALVYAARTTAQIQADAALVFSTLRAALPSAKIMYGSQLVYDSFHFVPAALKNKGTVPYLFALKNSGILANKYTSEMLDDVVSATTITKFNSWVSVDTYIKALTTITGNYTVNYYKIHRLGAGGPDGLHLNAYGYVLDSGYHLKGLRSQVWFNSTFTSFTLPDNFAGDDPDLFFSAALTSSGDGWIWDQVTNTIPENIACQLGDMRELYPASWYLPKKTRFYISGNFPGTPILPSFLSLRNGPVNSSVQVSVDGGAFYVIGVGTSDDGYLFMPSATTTMPIGAHTLRFMCDNEVYGPFAVTVTSTGTSSITNKLRVNRNSTQTLTIGVNTTILFNTVDANVGGAFTYNAATGIATCAIAGDYFVSGSCCLTASASATTGMAVIKNPTTTNEPLYEGSGNPVSTAIVYTCPTVPISMLVGDTIVMKAGVYSGVTAAVSPGATATSHATQLNIWN